MTWQEVMGNVIALLSMPALFILVSLSHGWIGIAVCISMILLGLAIALPARFRRLNQANDDPAKWGT